MSESVIDTYSHFSSYPIENLIAIDQGDKTWHKPKGLWLSVDGEDDWPAWCAAEDFCDTGAQYHYRIILCAAGNILFLKTADEIRSFHRKYKKCLI